MSTTLPKTESTAVPVKMDTEMLEITNEFSELETTIQELAVSLISIGKRLKKLEKSIGSLVKSRSKKVKTHKKEVPAPIAENLMKFMLLSEPLTTRSEALRKISDYVRKTGLQLQDDKRTFVTDKVLSDLFAISVGEKLTFLAINKFVTPLFLTDKSTPVVKATVKVAAPSTVTPNTPSKVPTTPSKVPTETPKKKVVKKSSK
jgi:chromatin remodeling complex protein RSC6